MAAPTGGGVLSPDGGPARGPINDHEPPALKPPRWCCLAAGGDGGDDDDTETTTLRRGLPGKLPSQRHQGSRLAEAPTLLVLRRGTPPSNARSTAVLAWPCRLVTRYVGQQELPFMIQTHWRRRDAAKARANGWNPQ